MSPKIVHLVACSDSEYAVFARQQVAEYGAQLVRAGEVSAEDGSSVARERLQDLSGDRLRTQGHEFFVARSAHDATLVGWAWLAPPPAFLGPDHERTRWLSQLTVEEPRRGQGWGRAILTAIERYERSRGSRAIWLRVFDWNTAARRLYLSEGYEVARKFSGDAHMCKALTR